MHYNIAFITAIAEFFSEFYAFEKLKNNMFMLYLGLAISTIGQIFRLGAFISARSNFHHLVRVRRE